MKTDVTTQENRSFLLPAYDVVKEEDAILLRIEMPGVEKEALDITVENNRLFVTGNRKQAQYDGSWLIRERRQGAFRRVFTLDDTIDPEAINAEISQGVVHLRIGFKAAAKPRRIEVKAV